MAFLQEQKTFILEFYFRNGHKIDAVWQQNIPNCLEEFRYEFSEVVFNMTIFQSTINYCITLFRETESIDEEEDCG
ncbi:hypothetical protein BDFB_001589 [Asbolus verrucosus]|uniref:Uncharacterized protein n=1 Tax=Asbolus verrucosus TaxID=1661398 RepID=A0A482VCA0_ASBVE|nr:hypothetical protein BDFB_001589 [Asbolus verrucosus]